MPRRPTLPTDRGRLTLALRSGDRVTIRIPGEPKPVELHYRVAKHGAQLAVLMPTGSMVRYQIEPKQVSLIRVYGADGDIQVRCVTQHRYRASLEIGAPKSFVIELEKKRANVIDE